SKERQAWLKEFDRRRKDASAVVTTCSSNDNALPQPKQGSLSFNFSTDGRIPRTGAIGHHRYTRQSKSALGVFLRFPRGIATIFARQPRLLAMSFLLRIMLVGGMVAVQLWFMNGGDFGVWDKTTLLMPTASTTTTSLVA
ncbi:hypothetical protein FOZ63_015264, partial [Perkinsus olseni]